MYEHWIIALLIAPLAISLASFACGVTKHGQFVPHFMLQV